MCKMRYVDTVNSLRTITPVGPPGTTTYRINSLWDPLLQTASEQNVAGYAELANMYRYYRVHACKHTVDISLGGTTTPSTLIMIQQFVGINAVAGASNATALNAIGNPYTVWDQGSFAGKSQLHTENYVKCSKLVGSTNYATDLQFAGPYNGNPTTQLYSILYFIDQTDTQASTNYSFTMVSQLEFWCEWFERDQEVN